MQQLVTGLLLVV